MPLSPDAVEHVARLAHVGLTPQEIDEYTHELSSVLDHVAKLQAVDTSDVPPTSHVVHLENVMRDDVAGPSWPVEAVLFNAPRRVDDFFAVQAIFD